MSAPGRPKRELFPLGGTARSAKGADQCAAGTPAMLRVRHLSKAFGGVDAVHDVSFEVA